MILRVVYIMCLSLSVCLGDNQPSIKTVNPISVKTPNVNEHIKVARVFEGTIEKIGFFKRLSLPYQYCLTKDKNCIAYLDANEKSRMSEIFKTFLNKKVIIKGVPQYINKEPYLVISVNDVCGL